uniref:WD_REPEATS_REGION domain-containing protein n=1 Tax=Caenorhabditis japonica TaxID=281687 RepID=A0A8R1IAY1_CAEJA
MSDASTRRLMKELSQLQGEAPQGIIVDKTSTSNDLNTAYGHTARPYAIAIHPHQNLIFTGGIEQTLFCWKFDDEKIQLIRKTVLSIGVIRKITVTDDLKLFVSSQDGNIIEMDTAVPAEQVLIDEKILNFAHVNENFAVLSTKNELIVYDSDSMDKILFRCGGIRHMSSSEESLVAWNNNTVVFFDGKNVYRLKLSINIISATCHLSFICVKTIDGFIQVYKMKTPGEVKLVKRFRPSNPSMIPSVFSVLQEKEEVEEKILVFGSTHGEIFHGNLKDSGVVTSLTRKDSYQCFGGKEVTCIEPIPGTCSFMTLGKMGLWCTMTISDGEMQVLNTRSFTSSSRMAWPSKFLNVNGERLIAGFYEVRERRKSLDREDRTRRLVRV